MKVDELTENKTLAEVIKIIDNITAEKPETSSREIINSEEDDVYEDTDYYEDDGYEEDDEDDDCGSVEKEKKALSKNKKKSNEERKDGFNDPTRHLVSGQENLRGLLPTIEKPDEVADPTVKRCFTEHCYFAKNLLNNEKPKTIVYENLKSPPDKADPATTNTLPFPNENTSKREQLTIDGESSRASEKCEVAKSATSRESLERPRATLKTGKKTWRQIKQDSCGNTDESELDDKIDGEYFPEENSSESEENLKYESDIGGRCRNVKKNDGAGDVLVRIKKKQTKFSHKKKVKILKNVSSHFGENKKLVIFNRSGSVTSSGYLKTNKVPVKLANVERIFSKLNKMQKFVNSKIGETTVTTATGNREKIPPPKLKRVTGSNRTKPQNFNNRVPSTFLLVPNLTKMAGTTPTTTTTAGPTTTATPANKNWRVRYMENDVQSLGLDDLLLKASELNAENFTKALGRKLETVKSSNFNGKENSEIVLTIPKFKGHSTDVKQYAENFEKDPSTKSPVKSMKMDFFTDSHSSGDKEVNEEDSKKTDSEISPKKTGIKVKTVENINEEFKDSLESKKKESKDSTSLEKTGTTDGNRVDRATGKSASPTEELSIRRGERGSKLSSKDSQSLGIEGEDNGRPFIMTIVQEKLEKQRPAILRNSACFKKKTGNSDGEKEKYDREDDKEFNARSPGEYLRIDKNDDKEMVNCKTEAKKGSFTTDKDAGDESRQSKYSSKKKGISFILNQGRKGKQVDSTQVNNMKSGSVQGTKLVKGNCQNPELPGQNEKASRLTNAGQKPGSKEENKRFVKTIPYEPETREPKTGDSDGQQLKNSDQDFPEKTSHKDSKSQHLLSLSAFSSVLKEILPDKWFLCLDKRYGLQIMKTHVDESLNPCVLMSVVIARCGKVTVNVRGKQLDQCHQLFANLCDIKNPDSKLSLNYILAILNKLRYLSVCHGSYPALKKYSPEDESTAGTGNQQEQHDYRSPFCPLLVSLGKKRCYPCYRMKESLKKRHRRSKTEEKTKETDQEKEGAGKESSLSASPNEEPETETVGNKGSSTTTTAAAAVAAASGRGVKRNLEDFLEESFSTMKQQIEDELEKNKKFGEMEKALKAQEEVLSFMGLTRKDNLDGNPVRKSRRTRSSFYKNQSQQASNPDMNKIDQKELQFLETYWSDINTLFSTSLLFGAYSRTGRSRLREKCRMFYKLLSTWREIVRTNPDWIGGEIVSIPDEDFSDEAGADRFDKMDVTALRAYIINSVKEVNRIKHKLRTRNSYFKLLYNKFVKRRMRRSKSGIGGTGGRPEDYEEKKETPSSANSTINTPTDLSSDESSREKEKTSPTNPSDNGKGSSEENNPDGDKTTPDPAVPETTNSPVEPTVCPPTEPVPSPNPLKQD